MQHKRRQPHHRHNAKRTTVIGVGVVLLVAVLVAGFLYWQHLAGEKHVTPMPIPEPPQKTALQCVADLPLDLKIGQKIMPAVYAGQVSAMLPALQQYNIGGVIVMDEATADQISQLTNGMAHKPFIAVDQEGGTVQRYKENGIVPGAAEVATMSTDEAYQLYLTDATYLKSLGITTNFAPVVDVISRQPVPLPDRLYSSDPAVVTSYARQMIKASQAAGLTPVIKHFPGLGSATGNTDFGSATTDPLATLQGRDLVPYRNLAVNSPDAMVNNAIIPDLTDGQPAVWSPAAVTLLRSLGYQNAVVYSDSLTANAIPGELDAASVKAWQAGIDIAVIVQEGTDLASMLQQIVATATANANDQSLSTDALNQSLVRIFARKGIDPCGLTASS